MMEMPPLPEPKAGYYYCAERGENAYTAFTADQMRAHGELCARMAREEERERILALFPQQYVDYSGEAIAAAIRSES